MDIISDASKKMTRWIFKINYETKLMLMQTMFMKYLCISPTATLLLMV